MRLRAFYRQKIFKEDRRVRNFVGTELGEGSTFFPGKDLPIIVVFFAVFPEKRSECESDSENRRRKLSRNLSFSPVVGSDTTQRQVS
jgi:hypothetical protein